MPRGYRCILVAFVGWLSLAAQQPDPSGSAQQNQTTNSVAQTAQNIAAANYEKAERLHRAEYEAQCYPRKEKRDSDLCAQWKAADAAADTAWWAAVGTWVSGLSGVLVLIALGFAFEANRIARRSAHWQLRPYVYLTNCNLIPEHSFGASGESDRGALTFYFKNFGETPAKHATLQAQWSFRGHFNEPFLSDFSKATVVQLGDLPPDFTKDQDGYYVLGWHKMRDTVVFGEMDTLFVEGIVKYADANGQGYETVFRLGATGEDYHERKWNVPPHGNRAT